MSFPGYSTAPVIERYHDGEFLYSEANGNLSRDKGVLASGQSQVQAGTILGRTGSQSETVQSVTLSGSPTGGTFAFTINGQTVTVPYNASAAAFQALLASLNGIQGIGSIDPVVSGTGPWQITGLRDLTDAEAQPTLSVSGAGLTGGTSPSAAITTGSVTISEGTWAALNLGASDGSQTPAGILYGYTDATNAATRCVVVTRNCEVNSFEITYPAGATAAQIVSINNTLAGLGIIVRAAV
jgi:hypothetical protein